MGLEWMAWTWPTAVFFVCVALALTVLTLLELKFPTRLRQGLLPIATTRGDRFFISLLTAAFVHVAWLASSDLPVAWATLLAAVIGAGLMRWG